jgi:RHS repeat-associated protein
MPGMEVTQFTSYDNDGNLLQRVDGNSVTTNYVYNDRESLLTDIQYPATTSLNVHFTYDSYGRRTGMTDSTGSQTYAYGNLDELLSVTTTYTGLSAKSVSYTYYPDGSRESMATPAGTFAYDYDAAGRPASMTNPFSETTSWTYQNNNWLQTQTLHNGATATYRHNAMGHLTELVNQLGGSTISDFSSIGYDGFGNRTSVTATIPGTTSLNGTTSYTFDTKNQLTQESSTRNGGFTESYGYDSAGNPTTFKGLSKTYNSNNQQTGTGFSYDGNGNPTTYGSTTLTFDPENRMTSYGSGLTAAYNGDGLRAWKVNGSGTTFYIYDGTLPVVELDASGAVTASSSFGPNGLISRTDSATRFYQFDSEGSTTHQSDNSGSLSSIAYFDSHGSLLSGSAPGPFGYKGQAGYYLDPESGLQALTYRYYDPSTGRFLTRDPSGYSGGINLYSYVTNNPVNLSDSLGLDGWGNDAADGWARFVERIRARLTSNPDAVDFNTIVNYAAGSWSGLADPLRIGNGVGNAAFNPCAKHPFIDVLNDGIRGAQIAAKVAGAGSGFIGEAPVPEPINPSLLGQEAGSAIAIPEGAAGPTLTRNGLGSQYTGGAGGNGLAPSVNNVRIMEPTARYPNGYVNYGKTLPDGSWQSVNPYTGQSVGKSSSWWHIPRQ